jgi:molecular chaperone GrpE (heat shock protein)
MNTLKRTTEQTIEKTHRITEGAKNEIIALAQSIRASTETACQNENATLPAVIEILDHVFALTVAARCNGSQQTASKLLDNCRAAVGRFGLVILVPLPGERFSNDWHRLADLNQSSFNAAIVETVAAGYSLNGRLLRQAVVILNNPTACL